MKTITISGELPNYRLCNACRSDNDTREITLAYDNGAFKQGMQITLCKECRKDLVEVLTEADRPQKWVPCSERLPDKNGWYLLAQAFEWGIEYETGVWKDGIWWINDNSHVTIAWKPIEPYKEKNASEAEGE